MALDIKKFERTPFLVEGAQVNTENIEALAAWCKGTVHAAGDIYIQVPVKHPLNERQSRAFVGDWILFANNGYKVYTQVAFERNFQEVKV